MKKIMSLALTLVASVALGCTSALTVADSNRHFSLNSTVGVATVTTCSVESLTDAPLISNSSTVTIIEEDDKTTVIIKCPGVLKHSDSRGFTGWDVVDAAVTGFLSWITFGAVTF